MQIITRIYVQIHNDGVEEQVILWLHRRGEFELKLIWRTEKPRHKTVHKMWWTGKKRDWKGSTGQIMKALICHYKDLDSILNEILKREKIWWDLYSRIAVWGMACVWEREPQMPITRPDFSILVRKTMGVH